MSACIIAPEAGRSSLLHDPLGMSLSDRSSDSNRLLHERPDRVPEPAEVARDPHQEGVVIVGIDCPNVFRHAPEGPPSIRTTIEGPTLAAAGGYHAAAPLAGLLRDLAKAIVRDRIHDRVAGSGASCGSWFQSQGGKVPNFSLNLYAAHPDL
jgi:hypothetical protein